MPQIIIDLLAGNIKIGISATVEISTHAHPVRCHAFRLCRIQFHIPNVFTTSMFTAYSVSFSDIIGYFTYHQFNIQQSYVLPHTVYLCVLCGSENKQRLFPYTA
jgi:hypothetical protein